MGAHNGRCASLPPWGTAGLTSTQQCPPSLRPGATVVGSLPAPLDFRSFAGQTEYLQAVQAAYTQLQVGGRQTRFPSAAAAAAAWCRQRLLRHACRRRCSAENRQTWTRCSSFALLHLRLPPCPPAQASWLTPVEIFHPHYARGIAACILQRWQALAAAKGLSGAEPPLTIYEIGGGTGTLARDILVGLVGCGWKGAPAGVPHSSCCPIGIHLILRPHRTSSCP